MAKAKRKPRKRPDTPQRDDVTPERAARNGFTSAGMARRIIPVIDMLAEQWQLDIENGVPPDKRKGIAPAEHRALAYYRDQASIADSSPVRSCCDMSPRGSYGPGVAIISAQLETHRMEQAMGALWSLARAVAVDDKTLTQWCIERHGGRERYRDGKCLGVEPKRPEMVAIARLELRYAAGQIAAYVGA